MEENLKAQAGQKEGTTMSNVPQQQQPHSQPNMTIVTPPAALPNPIFAASSSAKALKRCLSVPIIRTLSGVALGGGAAMTTRSAAAAAAAVAERQHETSAKYQQPNAMPADSSTSNFVASSYNSQHTHIGIPRSTPSSREVSPAPVFNIFAPRARRYSASYSSLGAPVAAQATAAQGQGAAAGNAAGSLCITPRVSQLRQEECVDLNSREQNHEREVHSAMQMSQSWEDLTLVAENWSCKSDELSNPLQVMLPSGVTGCSSPSPNSNRVALRLPYGLSPSPTRRTFATRRSMSPIAMRPSQLGPVKRKFELDDNNSSNWNVYSPPPLKKFVTESRGSSPICQSPSSVCPSPDSGTFDGRITPKILISKLCTTNTNTNNSVSSSPMSASLSNNGGGGAIVDQNTSTHCSSSFSSSSSSSSSASSISGGSEPMCIGSGSQNIDEGISIPEITTADEKQKLSTAHPQPMSTDIHDEAARTLYAIMMDDMKSETSSIGGCSSISVESSSCDGKTAAASFLNKLNVDDFNVASSTTPSSPSPSLSQKNFFINKQSLSGATKFIVNHDNLPNLDTAVVAESTRVRSSPISTTTSDTRLRDNATAVGSLIVENKL